MTRSSWPQAPARQRAFIQPCLDHLVPATGVQEGETRGSTLSPLPAPQETVFVLDNANLRGVNLANPDLKHISLTGSNLTNSHLVNTDLSNADLSDANLYHAYLDNVDLSGATLSGADLSDVDLRNDTGLTQEQVDEP